MVKLTIPEAELIEGEAARGRHREKVNKSIAAGLSNRSAPQFELDCRYIKPPGKTKMCVLDRDIRPCAPGSWVNDDEYEERMKFKRDHVLPHPAKTAGHVMTGLCKDGSASNFNVEIPIPEYFRRYRKWRRFLSLRNREVAEDLVAIRKVTGWTPGCDNWLLRLLRLGPRPQRR